MNEPLSHFTSKVILLAAVASLCACGNTEIPTPTANLGIITPMTTPTITPTNTPVPTEIAKDGFSYYDKEFNYKAPNGTIFHFPKGYYNAKNLKQIFDPYCQEPLSVTDIPVHYVTGVLATRYGGVQEKAQAALAVNWIFLGLTYNRVDVYSQIDYYTKSLLALKLYAPDNFKLLDFNVSLVHEIAGHACRLNPKMHETDFIAVRGGKQRSCRRLPRKPHMSNRSLRDAIRVFRKSPHLF